MTGPAYGTADTRPSHVYTEEMVLGVHNRVAAGGWIRSEDWDGGDDGSGSTAGWYIGGEGDRVVFNSGEFRGSIVGASIDIGGSDATSFHVDTSGQMWLGAGAAGSAPFKVTAAGVLTAAGATITGTLRTAASGERVEISSADFNKVKFYTGDAAENENGYLYTAVNGSGSTRYAATVLKAPTLNDAAALGSSAFVALNDESIDNTTVTQRATVAASTDCFLDLIDGTYIDLSGDQDVHVSTSGSNWVNLRTGTTVALQARVAGGNADVRLVNAPTSSTDPLCRISSTSGQLFRDSSSRRYKTDIRDIDIPADVIDRLRPVSFTDHGRDTFGLVAEEVFEVCPQLVALDADGRPDAVLYDKLAVLLLAAR